MKHRMEHWLRRVSPQDWAWIGFFSIVGIVWPLLTLADVPEGLRQASLQSITIFSWFGLAMLGAIIAITGILMYSQFGTKWRPIGAAAELTGLILITSGPTIFGLVYAWLFFIGHPGVRPTLLGLALSLVSGIAVRFTITVPRFRREKNDETKDV